jgi:peptidoglycan/LPS O-acetylase OafA/YrhL
MGMALADPLQTLHKSSQKKSKYRPEIDGLRAFAVTAVIINHFSKNLLPGGYLGVDIFFVISGYVITSSLWGRESNSFADFISGFYERRIKRLVPALVVFVLVTSLLICFVNPEPSAALKTGIASLFGFSNLFLFRESTSYFAQSTQLNPFTHTWSLGVEEQFYLLFPFLIWFSGFGRQAKNGARNLFLWIGILAVPSLIGFIYLYQSNQPAAYFLMPTRFWEMAAGCLVYVGFQKRAKIEQALAHLPPLLVLAGMVGVMFLPLYFAVPATITIVLLSAILLACLKNGTAAYAAFTNGRVVSVGLISYSLYLWHWGVLSISQWSIGIHWWSAPFQLAAMLILALGSFHFIERPIRNWRFSSSRGVTISAGIGTIALSAGMPFLLAKQSVNNLFLGNTADLEQSGVSSLITSYQIKGSAGKWAGNACVLSDNNEVGVGIDFRECTLGDFDSARRRVLVIGNSFSSAFAQAFDEIVRDDHYAVMITSSWGASPVREIPNTTPWNKANDYYWDTLLPQIFDKMRKGDVVFAINDLAGFSPGERTSKDEEVLALFERGMVSLSRTLSAKGISLVYLHGLPFAREANCTPDAAIPQWYAPFGSPRCSITGKSESLKRRYKLNKVLSGLQANNTISVVDLFDVFCPKETCTYYGKNNAVMYRDEFSHPSVEAVRLSAPLIKSVLLRAHVK